MADPKLNPAQAQAVEHHTGPLLVLAGAGSGKTGVITHRIARLIERGAPPSTILALTFTNKAAGEMRERIARVLHARGAGSQAKQLTISTFHSFGLQVLTKEKAALGGTFTIFDQGDALGTIKEILRGYRGGKNFDAGAILSRISNAKNAFQKSEEMPDDGVDEYDGITKEVFPKYQSALRQFKAFDFDDLVCEVARLFGERADILGRWQERFRFLLVDEYQDTNRVQLELLRLLAQSHRNICVVGDDDQSIYAWRGADVRNILEFEAHFPGAKVIKLEQNYRSRAPILAVANAVIERRIDAKYRKTLFTDKPGGTKVRVRVATTPEVEAAWVGREIKRSIRDEGRKAKECAVLYRSNGQAKLIEEALREQGVPYRLVGGQQFFERKEVKDILAYLKLALNPSDEISLRRILNYPARGIGEQTVDKLVQHALAKGWSLWQAVERVDALDDIANAARQGCNNLERIVNDTRRDIIADRKPGADIVQALCDRIALRAEIDVSSGSGNVAARRWGNVDSLFGTFKRRDAKRAAAGHEQEDALDFAGFLRALTLDFGSDEGDGPPDAVTLSTLHGSKGLEFELVFLIGCEEGYLPHTRTLESKATDAAPQDIEEERRLFYVGVTRAREELFLSRAKHRVVRGKPSPRTPSRFLTEVPPELVDEADIKDAPALDALSRKDQADALLAALGAIGGPFGPK